MTIWWKVSRYGCEIEPVQVTAETKCFITIKPWKNDFYNNERRTTIGDEYHRTFAEARAWVLDRISNNIRYSLEEVDRERVKFGKVFKMEEPPIPQE
jgi:hypothetical protein